MNKSNDFDKKAAHKYFSAACYNRAWDLIGKSDRTPEDTGSRCMECHCRYVRGVFRHGRTRSPHNQVAVTGRQAERKDRHSGRQASSITLGLAAPSAPSLPSASRGWREG